MSSQKGLISSKGGALWSSNGYVATGREEREEGYITNDEGKTNSYLLLSSHRILDKDRQTLKNEEALQR